MKSIYNLERKDFWVLLLIRPPFAVLINYWLIGKTYLTNVDLFIQASLVGLLAVVFSWRAHVFFDRYTRFKFPEISQIRKRITWAALCHIQITILMVSALYIVYYLASWTEPNNGYIKAIVTGFCTNLSAMGFHEAIYLFNNWKTTHNETEELKKNNLKSKLNGLQSRVNPHFLFNSINTLSSLIEEDVSKAEQFLDELSKVYRYMLQVEKTQLVKLGNELEAISSLFFVLKTRFGDGIEITIDVTPPMRSKYIPILTLQQIVESIIEKNSLSKREPLHIEIRSKNSLILEIGNVNRVKMNNNEINDSSFEHIVSKYKLMGLPAVTTEYHGEWRWIKIPVIESE